MTTIVIEANYDSWVDDTVYTKQDSDDQLYWGLAEKGGDCNTALRFPLTTLPETVEAGDISQVRLHLYCESAGEEGHLTNVHPYGGDGQDDPNLDDGETFWDKCNDGTPYLEDSTAFQTTGYKWLVLSSASHAAIVAAKSAVNRMSFGCVCSLEHEWTVCTVESIDELGSSNEPELEITYGEEEPARNDLLKDIPQIFIKRLPKPTLRRPFSGVMREYRRLLRPRI